MDRKLVFRLHALQRMFERAVTIEDVRIVLASGETIKTYPDDTPYPSRLVLGWRANRPLHIVAADTTDGDTTIVITVYQPDAQQWQSDFKERRS